MPKTHAGSLSATAAGGGSCPQVLLSFENEGEKYYMVQPLAPCIIVGRQVSGAKFDVPEPSEVMRVGPVLEQLLQRDIAEDAPEGS